MISNVFMISRASGVCILHKSYSAKRQDESIISGYLTALNDFSQEIGGKTKELKMENSRLLYEFADKDSMFVFVVEETDNKEKKEKMNQAISDVLSEYKKLYPKGLNFSGDIDKYRHIGTDVLDKTMYTLALETGELKDIIEGRLNGLKNNNHSKSQNDKPFDLDNLEL